jgi:hypothetical protein
MKEILENDTAREEEVLDVETNNETPFLYSITGQTPWWIVSILLHALIITLMGLISVAIEMPKGDEPVIMMTDCLRPAIVVQQEKPRTDEYVKKVLFGPDNGKFDGPEMHDIVIPPETQAQISDRFTTDNGGLDDNGCWGVPEAKIFDPKGCVDEPGGGGKGGTELVDQGVIGSGGFMSKGSGGGEGGGVGMGYGPGTGNGRGTFGNRIKGKAARVKRGGGGAHTENGVAKALRWLAYHQEADGRWDSKKYGGMKVDTANTALALLAFLGAGHTEKMGEYKDNVKRAVQWLRSKQNAQGLVFDTTDEGGHRGVGYPGAMATLALAEAAGMANVAETKIAAQKAIDYCTEVHQQGENSDKLGFRYGAKQAGDISVTGWFVMALKSAKIAGLKVNAMAFDGAIRFIDKVELKNAGGDSAYGPASRYSYTPGSESNHRRCAIGNLARQFLGWKKEDLQSSVELFVKEGGVPSWGANGESVDLYYWYYGSLCCFQQGGDVWKSWNNGMVKALVDNQCTAGDDAGSWTPVGAFSGEWGRVGQTALGALCLEVYYRYELINK